MLGIGFDFNGDDPVLMAEVELATALIIAAAESDDRLSQEQIDVVLGVGPSTSALRANHEAGHGAS